MNKEELTKELKYKVNLRVKQFEDTLKCLKKNNYSNESIIDTIRHLMKSMQGDERCDYNCIEIDDIGNITINQAKLEKFIEGKINIELQKGDKIDE